MNKNLYNSLVSKLSALTPIFGKALFEVTLKKRDLTIESATPVDVLKIIREDLDLQLAKQFKTTNSVLLGNAALIIVDLNNQITYANAPAKQIFSNLSPDTDLFAQLKNFGFVKTLSELSSGLDIRDLRHEQLGRVFNVSITPLYDANSQPVSMVSIIQDVTLKYALEQETFHLVELLQKEVVARKLAENLLTEQYTRAASTAKMAALGLMAGGIAHEINTPLATIELLVGHLSQTSKAGPVPSDKILSVADKISKTTSRIAEIIRGLRSFSRDGGNDPYLPTSVRQIIDDTLSLCAERINRIGVMVEVVVETQLELECRSTQISQVLLNLITNSCDAMTDSTEKWIRIEGKDEPEAIELSITDSGSGLTAEAKKMLFQPFFTTKEIGQGTGLGLPISRGIVESHGGTLELDPNSPNTRFMMRFPKKNDPTYSTMRPHR